MLNKFNTYNDANKFALDIFKKENIQVYIYEIRILNNINYPYYVVSTNNNLVISDDRTAEIIKCFNPEK